MLIRCGEVCSHVAAILFKLEACTRLEISKLTCTSLPCTWNQVFSETVCNNYNDDYNNLYFLQTDAAPVIDINFQRPEKLYTNEGRSSRTSSSSVSAVDYSPTVSRGFLLQQLHKVYPSAAVFSVVSGFVHQEQLSEGMECGCWLF